MLAALQYDLINENEEEDYVVERDSESVHPLDAMTTPQSYKEPNDACTGLPERISQMKHKKRSLCASGEISFDGGSAGGQVLN